MLTLTNISIQIAGISVLRGISANIASGATVALVDQARAVRIADQIRSDYMECTGIEATTFASRPATGVRLLQG